MSRFTRLGRGARRSGAGVLVVATLLALGARPAHAQDIDDASRTAARALGNSGVEAYQAGNYKDASERLEKSYAIARVPSLGLWSARALRQLGLLVESANRYLETVSLQIPAGDYEIQKQAQADAQKEFDILKPIIPALTIEIKGAKREEVAVTVDGVPLAASLLGEPRLVNPGLHKVAGTHGAVRREAAVLIAEGQKAPAVLDFGPQAAVKGAPVEEDEAGSTQNTLAAVALAAGGAGIVVGGITGVMALGKKNTIDSSPACENDRCSDKSLVDSYSTLRTVSTIGFIVGGVLAATGVTLLLTAGPSDKPKTGLLIGPGSVSLRRTF